MTVRLHRYTIMLLLLLIKLCPALSQDIKFNKVTLPEENTYGLITGITQDLKGNIWFCSQNGGMAMYDGVNLKSYVHTEFNPTSLANNYVECVLGDRNGNVWAGTFGSGLEKFDPATGVFTHFKHDEKDPSSVNGDSITCLVQDREGMLWVGTISQGLDRMDPRTGKFTHYVHAENDPGSISNNQVRAIYEDKQGVIWVGTGSNFSIVDKNIAKNGGLNRFNKSTGNFTRYLHEENNPHSLSDNRVRAIFEDSYGTFWVGTAGDGLHTMDRGAGTFERHSYDPAHPDQLSRLQPKSLFTFGDDNITFITEDAKRTIWIGTFENGMIRYDPATRKIMNHYTAQRDTVGNFADFATWWGLVSRDGVMWVSTFGNNLLYRFDPAHQNIRHTELGTKRMIFSFAEEAGFQYFATDSGLYRVDKKTNSTQIFLHDPKKPGSLSDSGVFVLYKDSKNRIWAGSARHLGGLNLFNPDKQTFTVYKHDPRNSNSLICDFVFSIYEDASSSIWIGTLYGLDRLNVETGVFTHYKLYPDHAADSVKYRITAIREDSRQNLWVATEEAGLYLLDRKTGQFKSYLRHSQVLSLLKDNHDILWVGAADGLYSYNSVNDNFSLFTDPITNLSFYTIAMIEDNDKNLWFSAASGMYRINSTRNEVTRFGKNFDVDPNSFTGLTLHKSTDGKLFFGNNSGYYSFYPDSISGNPKPPEILLTDFRIADLPVVPGSNSALKEDLVKAKKIDLGYDQDVFSFSFNVIHFSNPEANRIVYMLENYDKGWRPTGTERTAFYYNIPPGHYIFRIKAASSEGVWAEKSIDVNIAAPWWHSWWAYLLEGLLLLGIILAINRILKQRVISAERERTRVRELEQAREIEKAYHDLKATQGQLIQSEKMASLGELTAGIAHEIQNPLNFVNNFSEVNTELIDEMQLEMQKGNYDDAKTISDNIKQNEQKINYQGKRADAIVKSMLQHSRTSNEHKEPTDINALADEYLRLSYHGLRAKDKSFNATMVTDFDSGLGLINVIPQDIGRVLLNLYNNAFYAVSVKTSSTTDKEYKPTVTVTTKSVSDTQPVTGFQSAIRNPQSAIGTPQSAIGTPKSVIVSVRDNGMGIPDKVKAKIFQPFFTTKPTGQGTGLGLSLSYDIIKAHGGEIKVDSREGEYTEFTIQLPV